MTGNNPKLGLVNVDVHTKFGQILSIGSQDIERKPNIHGITERRRQKDRMTEGQGESSIALLFQNGAIINKSITSRIMVRWQGAIEIKI